MGIGAGPVVGGDAVGKLSACDARENSRRLLLDTIGSREEAVRSHCCVGVALEYCSLDCSTRLSCRHMRCMSKCYGR